MNVMTMRDPTGEMEPVIRPRRAPLDSLDGVTVALLDIGKTRSDEYIDGLAQLMTKRKIEFRRYRKPTNTRTAPVELLQRIAVECQAVVIALSD